MGAVAWHGGIGGEWPRPQVHVRVSVAFTFCVRAATELGLVDESEDGDLVAVPSATGLNSEVHCTVLSCAVTSARSAFFCAPASPSPGMSVSTVCTD